MAAAGVSLHGQPAFYHAAHPYQINPNAAAVGPMAKRKRRHRTIFTEEQLEQLEATFDKTHYPDVILREQLALQVDLKEERIEVSFEKRNQKSFANLEIKKYHYAEDIGKLKYWILANWVIFSYLIDYRLTHLVTNNDTSLLATLAKSTNDDISLRMRWRFTIRNTKELYLKVNL